MTAVHPYPENFKDNENLPQPPPYEEVVNVSESFPTVRVTNNIHVDETSARAALLEEINKHCCYGSGAAKKLTFSKISTTQAIHLILNTFVEQREIVRKKVPYARGVPVDGPENGRPPESIWDLTCNPTKMFSEEIARIEVPHTSQIMTCSNCTGSGRIRCPSCENSTGYNRCTSCNGKGVQAGQDDNTYYLKACSKCTGSGKKICNYCTGTGRITCEECDNFGQVRLYLELKVTFKIVLHQKVLYDGELPTHLRLTKARGYELLRIEAPRISAPEGHALPDIIPSSKELINYALQKCQVEGRRILMQRHVVRSVPVSECSYMWENKNYQFWVYGTEHQVQLLDYPHTCCCCSCNIL